MADGQERLAPASALSSLNIPEDETLMIPCQDRAQEPDTVKKKSDTSMHVTDENSFPAQQTSQSTTCSIAAGASGASLTSSTKIGIEDFVSRRGSLIKAPTNVLWQWEHRDGFRNYDIAAIAKIEHVYQNGHSKVRIQSGKDKSTPMEIFFNNMIQHDPKTNHQRKVQRVGPDGLCQRLRRYCMLVYVNWMAGRPLLSFAKPESFEQYQTRREEYQGSGDGPSKYNVFDKYKTDGCAQAIAKSHTFFALSMAAVFLNSLWIAIETDLNDSDSLWDSDAVFIIIENTFCVVFCAELAIRFLAFAKTLDSLKDTWFRFDLALVVLMVFETWILPVFFKIFSQGGKSGGDMGALSVLRLARLMRLSRMTRLLRALPELMTLLKGIVAAFRSVIFTLLLLFFLLYVFAIIFRSQAKTNASLADKYFPSVAEAMWFLLMHGTFMDAVSDVATDLKESDLSLTLLFLLFILLSSWTVLNMLIGILCEVITKIKEEEDSTAEESFLRMNLLDILDCYDKDQDQRIGRNEFDLLLKNPELLECVKKFGTDAKDLRTLAEVIFDSNEREGNCHDITFEKFLEIVMRLKGSHVSSVTDIVELREYLRLGQEKIMKQLGSQLTGVLDEMQKLTGRPARPTVVVHLSMAGQKVTWRHVDSLTIAQLLQQHGQAIAQDAHGNAVGVELTLRDLLEPTDTELHLTLIPELC